jgi:pantothenate synthetase
MLAVLTEPDPHPSLAGCPIHDSSIVMSGVLPSLPDLNAVPVRLDYAVVVDPDTLLPIPDTRAGALLAIAAHIGPTRLIDNLLLPATTTT